MEQRTYYGSIRPDELAEALLQEWDAGDTIAQAFGEEGRVIVQIGQREGGFFSDEPHQALTLDIESIQDGIQVTMGQQQWFKGGGGGIMVGGLVGFFPFFFTFPLGQLFGGQQQIDRTLPGQIWQSVERYVGSITGSATTAAAPIGATTGPATGKTQRLATVPCPECGVANPMGAQRCSACGANLAIDAHCPQCGHMNPPGANFCNRCGFKLNPASQLGQPG
jgi:ribosomal protein L40E